MNLKDIVGKKFGRLVVVEFDGIRSRHYYWKCKCECGNQSVVDGGKLKSGHTQSCGCLLNERRIESHLKHGQNRKSLTTPEYTAWQSMKQRCNDTASKSYHRYGGRGIKICERWNDFSSFFEDMGSRPSIKHSIERIEVDGNYEPNNCKWATAKEQSRNKTNTIFVEYQGIRVNLKGICEQLGKTYHTVWQRIFRLEWDIDRAIDTPIKEKFK